MEAEVRTLLPNLHLALGPWAWVLLAFAVAGSLLALALVFGRYFPRPLMWLGLLRSRPLARGVAIGCLLVSIVPGLWAAVALGESSAGRLLQRTGERQVTRTQGLAARLDQDLRMRSAAIATLAALAASPRRASPQLSAGELEQFRRRYPNFLTLLSADREGRVHARAGQPLRRSGSAPASAAAAARVDDRRYFTEVMRTGQPYVSGLFRGRGVGTDPIIAVSAPLRDARGELSGIVEGSLNIEAWSQGLYATSVESGLDLLIVDPSGRVVHADGLWRRQPLDDAGVDARFREASAKPGTPLVAGTGAGQVLTTAARSRYGWYVLAALPIQTVRERVLGEQQVLALAFGLSAFFAVLIGLALARQVTAPVERLAKAMADRTDPASLASAHVSRYAPTEIRYLFAQFHALRAHLASVIEELRMILAQREKVIADRTAEIAAQNWSLRRLNGELEQAARSDPLTGIANRRAFDERLQLLWQTLWRVHRPLAAVIVDVDLFKHYNDHYGHLAGDACLRRVAAVLAAESARSNDLVARIGGEEFALLLAATDLEGARRVAEHARRALWEEAIAHDGVDAGRVTASFGVAALVPDGRIRPEDLLAAADAALYAAKEAGRNRVAGAAASPLTG